MDICDNNEGNNMCVVIETFPNKQTKNPVTVVGEYVLINGFENNEVNKIRIESVCCPSSDPA